MTASYWWYNNTIDLKNVKGEILVVKYQSTHDIETQSSRIEWCFLWFYRRVWTRGTTDAQAP